MGRRENETRAGGRAGGQSERQTGRLVGVTPRSCHNQKENSGRDECGRGLGLVSGGQQEHGETPEKMHLFTAKGVLISKT